MNSENHAVVPMPSVPLPSLRLVASPRVPRRIAKALLIMLGLTLVAMFAAPWQQTVRGTGQVVAYAPLERQQTVQANVSGRVHQWGEGIREGVLVEKGQVILELRDIDPAALERLQDQCKAYEEKLRSAEVIAQAYQVKLQAISDAQQMAIAAAQQEVVMAEQKVAAERQGLVAAEAARSQALAFFDR